MNHQGSPSVLIPIAPGTNRNSELATAFAAAGAQTCEMPLEAIRQGETKLVDHQILALPGGFSYGDALGAGRMLAQDLSGWFADQMNEAVERDMPIIGICNGFQALVKAGLLPSGQPASLAGNENGRFECRWVTLMPSGNSIWTSNLKQPLRCPIAHGEGRFVADDAQSLADQNQVAFRYAVSERSALCDGSDRGLDAGDDVEQAEGRYPYNPNGSIDDIAGIVNGSGFVLGLMPHPEDHVFARQNPNRNQNLDGVCLGLFEAGVAAALS